MITSDVDKLRKLLALALHGATPGEEARTAAMQACKLIEEHHLTIAGEAVTMPSKKWAPPNPQDEQDMRDIFAKYAASQQGAPAGPSGMKAHETDNDIDDDFMRKRITLAWRVIREVRRELEVEIELHRQRTGCHFPKPDWSKR